MKIVLKSPRETKLFAARFAQGASRSRPKRAARVFALVGDLGAGKTTFVQGFLKMFAVKQRVVSPTFLIFRSYLLSRAARRFRKAYHVDLYRIREMKDLDALGLRGILGDPSNIVLIEWAEKIKKILPKETIWLTFLHGKSENERIIKFRQAAR